MYQRTSEKTLVTNLTYSFKQNTKGMTTRFTYDIQTQQLVYAIVDKDGVCKYLTTSITDAIKLTQLN